MKKKIYVTRDTFAYIKEVEYAAAKGELSFDAFCFNQLGCEPYGDYEIVVGEQSKGKEGA